MCSEGYSTVCVCVCFSLAILAIQVTRWPMILKASELYESLKIYPETTAFGKYGVKTSEKASMQNQHWFTSTGFPPFSPPSHTWVMCIYPVKHSSKCYPLIQLVCVITRLAQLKRVAWPVHQLCTCETFQC